MNVNIKGRSLKTQIRRANRVKAPWVVIIGGEGARFLSSMPGGTWQWLRPGPERTMSRIQIWNYDAIAKNTRPDYMTVPDSGFRPGESEAEWLLRMLLKDLQALAAESRIQVAALTNFVPVADELTNGLDGHLRHAPFCVEQGLISQAMLDQALVLNAKLTEMCNRHDPSLFCNDALSKCEDWNEVRRLAEAALQAMGYDLEPPPPRSM